MTKSMDIGEAKLLTSLEKRHVQELSDIIIGLEQSGGQVNQFIDAAESYWQVMVAKLSKEKLKAHSAIANSRVLIATMERYIEVLEHKLEKAVKKAKLSTSADKSLQTSPERKQLIDKAQQTTPPRRRQRRRRGKSRSNKSAISRSKNVRNSNTPVRRNLLSIGTSNKIQNPVNSKTVSSNASLESNSTISESIVAEFERPFITSFNAPQKNVPPKAGLPPRSELANVTPPKAVAFRKSESQNFGPPRPVSLTAERRNVGPPRVGSPWPQPLNVETPKAGPPKIVPRKRKIYPVKNVTTFKKPHELLSCKSHIIYAPPSEILANLKPLHTGDPRTYYVKQALETKTGPLKLIIARKFKHTTAEKNNELRRHIHPPSEPEPQRQANDIITPIQERDKAILTNTQERDDTMLKRNASNTVVSYPITSTCNDIMTNKYHIPSSNATLMNTDSQIQNRASIYMNQVENIYLPTPTTSNTLGYKYKTSSITAEDSDSSSNLELTFSSSPDISEPDVSENKSSSLHHVNTGSSIPILDMLEPTFGHHNGVLTTPMSPDHPDNDIARSFMRQQLNSSSNSIDQINSIVSRRPSETGESLISDKFDKLGSFMLDQNKKLSSLETRTASPLPANSENATIISQSVITEFENPFVKTSPDVSRSSTPKLKLVLPTYMSNEPIENKTLSPIPVQSKTAPSSVEQGENTVPTATSPNPGYKYKSAILDISIDSDTSLLSLDFRYSMSPTFTELSDDDMDLEYNTSENIISSPNAANCKGIEPAILKESGIDHTRPVSRDNGSNSPLVSIKSESVASSSTQDKHRYTTDSASIENRPTTSITVKSEKLPNTLGSATQNSTSTPNPTISGRLTPTVTKIEENRPQNSTWASIGNKSMSIKSERQDKYEIRRTSSLATGKTFQESPMSPEHTENIPPRSFKIEKIASQGVNRNVLSPDHPDNTISTSFKSEKFTSRSVQNESRPTSSAKRSTVLQSPMSPDHPENTVARSFKSEHMSAKDQQRPITPVTEDLRPKTPTSPNHPYESSQTPSANKYPPTPKPLKYLEKRSTPMSPNHPENDVSRSFMKQLRDTPTASVCNIKEEKNSTSIKQENKCSPATSWKNRRVFSPVRNRQNYASRDRYRLPSSPRSPRLASPRSPRSPRLDRSRDVAPYSKHQEYRNIHVPTPQRRAELRHVCVPSPPSYRRRSKPYNRDSGHLGH